MRHVFSYFIVFARKRKKVKNYGNIAEKSRKEGLERVPFL